MALPFLPGNVFNRNLGKDRFHKSQIFDNMNSISYMFGDHKSGIGGDPLPGQRIPPATSTYPGGEGKVVPTWIAFDKQVLSFDAYYQEAVNERAEESFRIREIKIYFYLEDDSIQVIEPRLRNAGLPQGTIVRRHRVPKPAPHDDLYYTVHDFNVGIEINIYNRICKIVGCDDFTHNFLRKLGVRVNLPEKMPENPYSTLRKAMDESMQPLRPYQRFDTLRQFLDHDRHVLRFYCFWDDSDSLHGDAREMILHYFLSDDTIEIREVLPLNSGRDSSSLFLYRQKLPKRMDELPWPGDGGERTVLNVFGKIHSGRLILDSLKTGAVNFDYYHDSDLTIGAYVNVFGRKFLICDCDEFTKEYYTTKYGITEFQPIPYTIKKSEAILKDTPPFNGWGTVEDSFGNCNSLIPKPPTRDFTKFLEKDRQGLESHILRFKAHLNTDDQINSERVFVISYYLSDDTIQINEPPVHNSGIKGGCFLERGRVKKAGQERYSLVLPDYFTSQDLFVGAQVKLNSFDFNLFDADEYCLQYMENHREEYDKANIHVIVQRLRQITRGHQDKVREQFQALDSRSTGRIDVDKIHRLLHEISFGQLSEHEIITIIRHYAFRPEDPVKVNEIISTAQNQLRKSNFELFTKLDEAMADVDREGQGTLAPEVVRSVCKTMHLPIPDNLLQAVIDVSEMNEVGQVKYSNFIQNINWRRFPVSAEVDFVDSVLNKTWIGKGNDRPHFGNVKEVIITEMIEDILIKERVPRPVVYN